ncbi:MAG: peptidase [Planctomycetes bacterium]|nr:peptidase [Planctomycetota bacterium]
MRTFVALVLLVATAFCQPLTIEEKTKGFTPRKGFFTFWWDAAKGRLWLEIPQMDDPFIYVHSLASGLGSNPVGLDRKKLGGTRVVHFTRVGPRVLLMQRNLKFRALSQDAAERAAVEESFAQSVLFGFDVAAESAGRVLVDATDFIVRDAQGIARTLKRAKQGSFKLDRKRSVPWLAGTKAFPRNTEFEALLTFSAEDPGRHVRQTTPTPHAVTLRQHHSFVKLPPPGYQPRVFDPRAPSFSVSFADYATPLDQPLQQRWISRHRLEKKDPAAKVSEPKKPIVYYVDRGAPEPVRTALLEGARWWSEAFEAAGFKDAFRVEVMPENADPLDVRYNVINWVHRSTRGWSYGSSVTDPRTGEIIKGHVLLGSLRVRQDRLIFEGLEKRGACCGLAAPGGMDALAALDPKSDPVTVSLARLRQLSAHEVGHTLGFAHNFAASVNDRASVMDYPAPLVKVRPDGTLDFSDAYAVGIGRWDIYGVRYAYTQFAPGADEKAARNAIVEEWLAAGLHFLSDQDARSLGSAHPLAHLWDNGADAVVALRHALEVRRIALATISAKNVPDGRPRAALEETLVPAYLHHRFQLEAAAKLIGGYHYTYALRGDRQPGAIPVAPERQRAALAEVMRCLNAGQLSLPRRLLSELPPSPFGGRGATAEPFPRRTGAIFDLLAAAESAADLVLAAVLHPQRAARLAAPPADPKQLKLAEVLDTLLGSTWSAVPSKAPHLAAIQRVVKRRILDRLMNLAANPSTSADVRSLAAARLRTLRTMLENSIGGFGGSEDALRRMAHEDLSRFFVRPWSPDGQGTTLETPPGSPIGR